MENKIELLRIVADFMGDEIATEHKNCLYRNTPCQVIDKIRYDSDWNEFMQAWIKFRDCKDYDRMDIAVQYRIIISSEITKSNGTPEMAFYFLSYALKNIKIYYP